MPKASTFPVSPAQTGDVVLGLRGYSGPNTGADVLLPAIFSSNFITPDIFGADPTGSVDSTAALTKAVAAINTPGGPTSLLLQGMYNVSGTLTVTRSGVGIFGTSIGANTCGLRQTNNLDTLMLQATVPATGLRDIVLRDFCITTNTNAPTGGRGLTAQFVDNLQVVDVQIFNCYQSVNILGGAGQNWVNTVLLGPVGWASRQVGTYLVNIGLGPGNTVPSEITFSNFDWKGSTPNYLDEGIQITCADGIFFSNGHCGFTYTADLSITSAAAPAFVDAIEFNNVYFDGNNSGAGVGVQIFGSVQGITNVKFNSCFIANHPLHGVNISASIAQRIRFNDSVIESAAEFGIIATGGVQDLSILGCTFYNLNTGNVGAAAVYLQGCPNYRIGDCYFWGNNSNASGVNLAFGVQTDSGCSGGVVTDNIFRNCTTPMQLLGVNTTWRANRLWSGVPTVASAATLAATYQGFDYWQITGTTTISAGIGGPEIAEQCLALNFVDGCTVDSAGNIKLAGGANQAFTAGSMLTLYNDGVVWREAARCVA